jgi:putative N6-adenine-specific DNA methylase
MENFNFFATTPRGVEPVLADELQKMAITVSAIEKGGVRFSGDMATCYKANLWLRTANRILQPLAEFFCETPQHLYDGVRTIDWRRFVTPEMTIAVDCKLRDSGITHSGYAALKTKDAIVDCIRDHCGSRPSVDTLDPDLRINVHILRNNCTISLDTSGISLDKRGYRLDTGEAPLRETLAAALLELSGWDGSVPLVDPMCGAGTIVIEAALKACRRAPGLIRNQFGFQRWPDFDGTLWRQLVAAAEEQALEAPPAPILGYDISARAIENAGKNGRRAGVGNMVSFAKANISDLVPPGPPGIIVFNPPYGARLDEEEALKPLYKKIGDVLKQRCKGYTAYLFTGNAELSKCIGLKATRRVVLFNGPIECRLLKYELY